MTTYIGRTRNHPTAWLRRMADRLRRMARAYEHYALYAGLGLGPVALLYMAVR